MRSSIGRDLLGNGKVPTQSKRSELERCPVRSSVRRGVKLDGPAMLSPRGVKAMKSESIISPRARRITVTSTTTNTISVSRVSLKNISSAKLVKRPSVGTPATAKDNDTPRPRKSLGRASVGSTPAGSPTKKKIPLKRLSKGSPAAKTKPAVQKDDTSSPSSPSLSQTFKRPGRAISPMMAASSRDSSLSPPRVNSWGSIKPHDVTTREQWDALISHDMEIADEITESCERLAEASASVDAVADQIREMESRDVLYYSACETRSNMSSMYHTPPPERSPSPDTEFGSVSGVLQRSQKVQDITERRGNLVRELLLDPPEPPLPPPGLHCDRGGKGDAQGDVGSKWERREQLIRELMESAPPRKEVATVSCDISLLSAEPSIKAGREWKPTERRFSKQPNSSTASPLVSSSPNRYR